MIGKYQDFVFNFVLYKLNDYHEAKDITSHVMALYCLKCNYLDDNRIKGWLINTAKNYLKKYYTKKTIEKKTFQQFSDQVNYFLPEEIIEDDQITLSDAFKEAFDNLSDNDLNTIMLYLRCKNSIKKMHEIIGGSYPALRKQISRIKKKLRAETYKNLGYYGSKLIVTPELDNQIYQFLRRFKQNLEAGTLEKMHYYFSEVDIQKYNRTFDIHRILDYDYIKHKSIHKIWVFFYNSTKNMESFFIEFIINEKNHLKIITPPTSVMGIVVIEPNSNEGKQIKNLLETYPIDKSGRPKFPKSAIKKIVQQHKKKQKKSTK